MEADSKRAPKEHPAKKAGLLSRLTFSYMIPIFYSTIKRGLSADDLFQPLTEHQASILGCQLENVLFEAAKTHRKYPLHRACFNLFGKQFLLMGLATLFNELSVVIIWPMSIATLVHYFDQAESNSGLSSLASGSKLSDALAALAYLSGSLIMSSFICHASMMSLMHIGMKIRVACSSAIFRKSLRINQAELAHATAGKLVNLLTNDAGKVDQGFPILHYVWVAPLQAALGLYLIYREIGLIPSLVGFSALVAVIPFQVWLGKRSSSLRLKTAHRTDERVRLMNEVLAGMQVIKMYCWEKPFQSLISSARRKEMQSIASHAYMFAFLLSFETFITRSAIFLSMVAFLCLTGPFNAAQAFAVTAIYNIIRPILTCIFTYSISILAEIHISLNRIGAFLALPEQQPVQQLCTSHKIEVKLVDVTSAWSSDVNCLKNVSLEAHHNQFVGVIGLVGAGKSSLLHLLLGELVPKSGELTISGRISYAAQEPWLFPGTIRENILFGCDWDEDRYNEVVRVCSLERDFTLWPNADATLVGDRGAQLSGGQKARVSLARCVYRKADIYLLDDPLSAVDASVGRALLSDCIDGFLRPHLRILVTHQLHHLATADHVLVMVDGEIQAQGTLNELQAYTDLKFQEEDGHSPGSVDELVQKDDKSTPKWVHDDGDDEAQTNVKISTKPISPKLYGKFLKLSGGWSIIALLVAGFALKNGFASGCDYFLSYWVETQQLSNNLDFWIFSGLTAGNIITGILQTIFIFYFFVRISMNLHAELLAKVMDATMSFFDDNPAASILNRFSKDLGVVDEYLPVLMQEVAEIVLSFAGSFILSLIVDIRLLAPSAVLVISFHFMRKFYVKTSRSVKRIEATTRADFIAHATSSCRGLSTIRAFGAQNHLSNQFDFHQDRHSAAWFLYLSSNRAFGFYLDLFCGIFVGCVVLLIIYFNNAVGGAGLGLVVTQYIGLMGIIQWGMRQWSILENEMISVERLLEYRKVPQEIQRSPCTKEMKLWPNEGSVQFVDVCLKYNPDKNYILNKVNFSARGGTKVGIVGRTGAGKSSTISALFQLYPVEGQIIVDDIDITQLPLEQVRPKFSIIPQDPVLFSGPMRFNLDPFDEYPDEKLWHGLDEVEMKEIVKQMPGGLNAVVYEAGRNFSVGQRQLICLARALIRQNKILVLDEATANVDPRTDALIQYKLREKFSHCTILTVAHRLNTVLDSDQILVMDEGRVVESGPPEVLLRKSDGLLAQLARTAGITALANASDN